MTGATGQSAIARFADPELELPSRVWCQDHDDDALTTPLPLGIATVNEYELPANDATPCTVTVEPPAGLKTVTHSGVFKPPLPVPYELNLDQSNVTELHVAVAVTTCASALAANTASNATTSGITSRARRTTARPTPKLIATGMNLSIVILPLLSAQFWI